MVSVGNVIIVIEINTGLGADESGGDGGRDGSVVGWSEFAAMGFVIFFEDGAVVFGIPANLDLGDFRKLVVVDAKRYDLGAGIGTQSRAIVLNLVTQNYAREWWQKSRRRARRRLAWCLSRKVSF